jgi:hypothetical protein
MLAGEFPFQEMRQLPCGERVRRGGRQAENGGTGRSASSP